MKGSETTSCSSLWVTVVVRSIHHPPVSDIKELFQGPKDPLSKAGSMYLSQQVMMSVILMVRL